MRLHQMIASEKFPNCRSAGAELEVSSKTVQRDIDFLRDQWGWPIEYDEKEFGYYYTEPVGEFPLFQISEGELAALFIAQKALAQYRGSVFEGPLRAACEKLATGLGGTVSVRWAELEAAVSFRSVGASKAEYRTFQAVHRAVLESVEVQFQYLKLRSEQYEFRRARPYHVACVEHQWYCVAFDLDRGELRSFVLPRMSKVKVTRVKFSRPADFSIQRYLSGSFGVFRGAEGGKTQRVRIRFDAWAARLVGERFWHESQEMEPRPGGEMVLRLELGNLEEVERWVLGWGEHAEVLAPKALRERIRRIAATVAGRG